MGQTQTTLEPRIYSFTTQTAVLPRSDAGCDCVEPALSFVSEPSNLVLHA